MNNALHTENISLISIKKYILKHFPETLWWDGKSKHEVFNGTKIYAHRQGLPNEIRIEFDGEDRSENWISVSETCINLIKLKYSFCIYYVEGGRSPHIHIYDIDALEDLKLKEREEYRKLFLDLVCPEGSEPDYGLCDEKHLCSLEFSEHFKYHKDKNIIFNYYNKRNMGVELSLVSDSKKIKRTNNTWTPRELKFGDKLKGKLADSIRGTLMFEQVFQKYGVEYRGKLAVCPFHAEKKGSLSWSNEKGVWKCFGCQAKGDIITLIKRLKEAKDGDKSRS